MDSAPIDVVAQIHLELDRHPVQLDTPFARRHQGLGDVVAVEDFLEHAARELVAAVGRPAAVAGGGLEEQLPAPPPQVLGLAAARGLGARNPCDAPTNSA